MNKLTMCVAFLLLAGCTSVTLTERVTPEASMCIAKVYKPVTAILESQNCKVTVLTQETEGNQ